MTTNPTKSHGMDQSDSRWSPSLFLMAFLMSLTLLLNLSLLSCLSCFDFTLCINKTQ